jgi:hypothetical protein
MTRYSVYGFRLDEWIHRPENRSRIELLMNVGIGGTFDSIIIVPRDGGRDHIVERYIGPTMRLIALDRNTGEFRAERV